MEWWIQGRGPGGPSPHPPPPLFLDQTEAQRAEKKTFGDLSPSSQGPRYLKVWIRFYYVSFLLFTPRIKLEIKCRIMMFFGFQ